MSTSCVRCERGAWGMTADLERRLANLERGRLPPDAHVLELERQAMIAAINAEGDKHRAVLIADGALGPLTPDEEALIERQLAALVDGRAAR
jgi:hypothetical protein